MTQGSSPAAASPTALAPTLESIDPRLAGWLAEAWNGQLASAGDQVRIEALAGDISARRYFRLRPAREASVLLAVYPEALAEAYLRFQRVTGWLRDAQVRVPAILATDTERRFMLLEDLGPAMLHEALSAEALASLQVGDERAAWRLRYPWFVAAIEAGRRIASLPLAQVVALGCEPLGADLLGRELEKTRLSFFEPRGLLRDPALAADFQTLLEASCRQLSSLPPAACHRDFMVRNLVPLGAQAAATFTAPTPSDLAVIDYQDLRSGPPVYDLASLLNDTLMPPPDIETELLEIAGITPTGNEAGHSERAYRLAAVQRTLKAIGSYAASGHHLQRIPVTLARTLHHLRQVPEAVSLVDPLQRAWSAVL